MSQAMIGCSVDGSITPVITGGKGISEAVQRLGPGHLRLKIDYPLSPGMYAVKAVVTELAPAASIICEKGLDLSGAIATVDVKTYAMGVATDLDFDISMLVFNRTQ